MNHKHLSLLATRIDLDWYALDARIARQIPARVRAWLCDRDSLTRQVQRACTQRFSVRLLHQDWLRVSVREAQALGIRHQQDVIVREVQLMCGETPWVYARSLIPRAVLEGEYTELGSMGTRPLGEKLFSDPNIQRGPVEVTCLRRGSPAYQLASSSIRFRPSGLFGRRSIFYGAAAPLMVMEFFLPTIGRFPDQDIVRRQ
ncbi:MAG: chorismate lyase [Pseudomonadota bacterium]